MSTLTMEAAAQLLGYPKAQTAMDRAIEQVAAMKVTTKVACRRRAMQRALGHYLNNRDDVLRRLRIFTTDSDLVLGELRRNFRNARQLGEAGHWAFDHNWFTGLWQALVCERYRQMWLHSDRVELEAMG